MLGHYQHASETAFQWRFAGGPMMAPGFSSIWIIYIRNNFHSLVVSMIYLVYVYCPLSVVTSHNNKVNELSQNMRRHV